jgi:hypothetical protein
VQTLIYPHVFARVVIPAKAGRSAQRGEHPKDGPEGVSEANHPATYRASKALDPSFRWDDDSVVLNFPGKLPRIAHFFEEPHFPRTAMGEGRNPCFVLAIDSGLRRNDGEAI